MSVSVPEKTLEHWLSIHLNYRYKAKASLWWPVSGEDISVADLPATPGKQFWIEVKTVTWKSSSGIHSLKINLWQLWKYGDSAHNPAGIPDYYVFPIPPFDGHITDPGLAWLGGRGKSSIGYESKAGGDWFARWTWVIPGNELRTRLASELAAWGARGMDKKKTFEIATIAGGSAKWSSGLAEIDHLRWHEFLDLLEACGKSGWGALLATPKDSQKKRSRAWIKGTFLSLKARDKEARKSGEKANQNAKQDLTYWVPGKKDEYLPLGKDDLASTADGSGASRAEPITFRSLVTLRYDAME
ncbi:hypothetical protein [Salinibacterium sp. GXW1014]|uniref:hypothetical protein n=1 Tax=Salinibacterium sp. GXW1014 TaxID=3377838 RepID=UPI00383BF018